MKTEKITVNDVFDKPRRYLVPLFQRGYVWTREGQWAPLWQDILYQVSLLRDQKDSQQTPRKHFLGAIVLNQASLGVRHTPASDVIDGQQRLTTIQLLLVAFRDVAATLKNEFLTAKLGRLTENPGPWPDDDERFKIWPTSSFRTDLRSLALAGSRDAVLNGFPQEYQRRKWLPRPQLVEAYLYFHDEIERLIRTGNASLDDNPGGEDGSATLQDPPLGIDTAEYLLRAITGSLQLVEISLDGEDDAQIIFETLNARGAPLQASDLIRNFVFLYATRRKEDVLALYENDWKSFDEEADDTPRSKTKRFWKEEERQGRLKSPRLDLFFYHYITFQTNRDIKISHIFQEFREWWDKSPQPRSATDELQRLRKSATVFKSLMRPSQTTRFGLFASRLKLLDTTTVYPLLLFLREREEKIGAEFRGIITDLESYLVRRAICNLTPKNYNRIFLQLLKVLRDTDLTREQFQTSLLAMGGESSVWPDDQAFEKNFLFAPMYTQVGPARTRMVLEAIERELHGSKQEDVSFTGLVTVEHVWPQNPKQGAWPVIDPRPDGTLDYEAIVRQDRLRHTVGNLTLVTSAFNSSLSNQSFLEKRPAITRESLLKLNSYFQDIGDEWLEAQIAERARSLFQHAKKIWPHPGPKKVDS